MIAGAPGKAAVLSRTVWDRPRYALRDERYKFLYDTRTGEEQLFDVEADPGEARDLAARGARCAPPTTARRCTTGSWAWAGAAAPAGAGGAHARAVREPVRARLHPVPVGTHPTNSAATVTTTRTPKQGSTRRAISPPAVRTTAAPLKTRLERVASR